MNSPAAPFAVAQEAAFRNWAALASAMGGTLRLYSVVPANAPLPYVVRGNDQIILDDAGCGVEAEVFSTLTLWSRPSTPDDGAQARAMGAALIGASVEFAVPGWAVDLVEILSERYSTDADQSTRGVIELRYLLTEQAA